MSEPNYDPPSENPNDANRFLARFDQVQLISIGAIAVAVIVGIIIASTAFGHHGRSSNAAGTYYAPTTSDTPSDETAPTSADPGGSDETSEAPSSDSASPAIAPLTPGVGNVVMDQEHADAICASAVSGDSDGSTVDLLPGGKALIVCAGPTVSVDGADENQEIIVSYDLIAQQQGWTYTVPAGAQHVIGTKHLIELDATAHPSTGLQDAYTTYRLTAINLATGEKDWSVPFESYLKPADIDSDDSLEATEGASGDSAYPTGIVVTMTDTSAFDAATGKLLWHVPTAYNTDASGSYQDGGIVVVDGGQEADGTDDADYGARFTGLNATTGKRVWDVQAPDWLDGNDNDTVNGNTVVISNESGYEYVNLVTGKVLGIGRFPAGWSNVTVFPPYAVAQVGGSLKLYKLTNLSTPVWSLPSSGDVTIDAATPGHLLVEGPSGDLILSTADGSTTTTLGSDLSFDVPNDGTPLAVDGMVPSDNGTVLELDPPTGH